MSAHPWTRTRPEAVVVAEAAVTAVWGLALHRILPTHERPDLLPDYPDLLRQRHPASGTRLHDYPCRYDGPLSKASAGGRTGLFPHRDRRARRQDRSGGGAGRRDPADLHRPDQRHLSGD